MKSNAKNKSLIIMSVNLLFVIAFDKYFHLNVQQKFARRFYLKRKNEPNHPQFINISTSMSFHPRIRYYDDDARI